MAADSVRRPGSTSTRPASWTPPGQWRLYRAWGDLPRESGLRRRFLAWLLGGRQQLLYIGITERTTIARWAEHMRDKWWAPDVSCRERDLRTFYSEAEVLAAEREAIIRERPVPNIVHNGNNPGAVRVRRRLAKHVVAARNIRFAAWALAWLVVWAGLWLAAGDTWPGWDGPRNSAVIATVALAAVWAARRSHRLSRPRRRSRRRR